MDELMDAQAAVSLCNVLLAYSGITLPVTCVQEVQALGASVTLFVAATEVLLGRRLDKLHRHPTNAVQRAANCASVLAALSATMPGLELSHILPSAVVAGDMVHMLSLLEILAELSSMPDVREQLAAEASQTAAAESRPAQDCLDRADSSRTAPWAKEVTLKLKAAPDAGSPVERNKFISDMAMGIQSPARKVIANSAAVPACTTSSRCSSSRSPTKQRKYKTDRTAAAGQGSARLSAAEISAAKEAAITAEAAAAAVDRGVQADLCLSTCQQSQATKADATKTVLQIAADSIHDTGAAKAARRTAADSTYGTADPRALSRPVLAVLAVAGDLDAAQAIKRTEEQLDTNIRYAGQQQQQSQQHEHCVIANAGQKAAAAPAAADGDVAVDTHRALQQLQLALSGAATLLQQHTQSTDTAPTAAAHMDRGNSLQKCYSNKQADNADVANAACVAADREQERHRFVEEWVIGAADAGRPQQQQQQQQQQGFHPDAAPTATRLLRVLLEEQIQVQAQLDSLLAQQQAVQQAEQQEQYKGVAAPTAVQGAVQHDVVHAAVRQTVQEAVQQNSTQSAHCAVEPAVQLSILQSQTDAAQHLTQLPAEHCLPQPVTRGLDAAAAAAANFGSGDAAAVMHQVPEAIQVGRRARLTHLHHTTLKLLAEVQQQQRKLLLQQQDAMQLCKQAEAAATAASQCEAAAAAATMQQADGVHCRAEALTAGQQLLLNQKSVLEASFQQINLLMAGLQSTEQRLLLQQQQILASMPMEAVQLSQGHHDHLQQQLVAPVLMALVSTPQGNKQQQPITKGLQPAAMEQLPTAQHPEQVPHPLLGAVHQQQQHEQQHEQQRPLGTTYPDTYRGQSSQKKQPVHSNSNRSSHHSTDGSKSNSRRKMRPSSGNSIARHKDKQQRQLLVQQQQLVRQAAATAAKVAAAAAEGELTSQRAWQQQVLRQHAAVTRRLLQKRQQHEELQEKQRKRDVKISQLQEQRVTDQACRDAERQQRQAAAQAAEAAPAIGHCTHYNFTTAAAAAASPTGSKKASVGRPGVSPAAAKAASRLRASCCSAARDVTDTIAAPQYNQNADAVPLHELQQLRQEYQQVLGVFEVLLLSERRGRMEAEWSLAQLVRQQRTKSRQQQHQGSRGGSPVKSPASCSTPQGGWMA